MKMWNRNRFPEVAEYFAPIETFEPGTERSNELNLKPAERLQYRMSINEEGVTQILPGMLTTRSTQLFIECRFFPELKVGGVVCFNEDIENIYTIKSIDITVDKDDYVNKSRT